MALRADNLTILQGTTWLAQWPLQEDGAPLADVTGWDVRAQARETVDSDEVLQSWTSEAGNISLDASGVTLRVDPPVSSAWDWLTAVYDIELFHTDGTVLRIAQGKIKVSPEVTR